MRHILDGKLQGKITHHLGGKCNWGAVIGYMVGVGRRSLSRWTRLDPQPTEGFIISHVTANSMTTTGVLSAENGTLKSH